MAACFGLLPGGFANADEPNVAKKPTFWVIPHTHWEGAVFKTREEYLEVGLPNIVKAMRLLREQPGFRFTLDQVAYVRPFLERYPGHGGRFPPVPGGGRLQLVGCARRHARRQHARRRDLHPPDAIRQGLLSRKLGVDVTTGWLIDTFGHHAQLPQLLTQGRLQDILVRPRRAPARFPSEFFWEGIDGTRIASI